MRSVFPRTISSLLAAGSLLTGCALGDSTPPPTEDLFVEGSQVTRVAGFAYDPEAFYFSLQTWECLNGSRCGPSDGPFLFTDTDHFNRSRLNGIEVGAVDLAVDALGQSSDVPSAADGTYLIEEVPTRTSPGYLLMARAAVETVSMAPLEVEVPEVPPANYVPTLRMRPMYATESGCFYQESPLLSDKGILEAVAKYVSSRDARGVTVQDLLDPAKYQGLGVFWFEKPNEVYISDPADAVTLEASAGEVFYVGWARPGDSALPAGLAAIQSTRGFYVDEAIESSPLGVAVLLVPAGEPVGEISFSATDGSTDAAAGRPWKSVVRTTTLRPGLASLFREMMGELPENAYVPKFTCRK